MIADTCPCGAAVTIHHGLIAQNNERHDAWLASHAICREQRTQNSDERYAERDLAMYLEAQKRYMAVTDAVFESLADGDVHGLIEFVMAVADGCDYVDEQSIEMAERAAERFPSSGSYPSATATPENVEEPK